MREKINPYGYTDVKDSVEYIRELRTESREQTEEKFMEELLTAMLKGLPLMTRNLKHFKKFKGLAILENR